jgi:hypothetical protein
VLASDARIRGAAGGGKMGGKEESEEVGIGREIEGKSETGTEG